MADKPNNPVLHGHSLDTGLILAIPFKNDYVDLGPNSLSVTEIGSWGIVSESDPGLKVTSPAATHCLALPDSSLFPDSTDISAFTFLAKIKLHALSAYATLLGIGHRGDNLVISCNTAAFRINRKVTVGPSGILVLETASQFSVDTVYHVAVTFDGNVYRQFIDGAEIASVTDSNKGNPYTALRSIMGDNTTQPINCTVYDVRIWNVAKSQSEMVTATTAANYYDQYANGVTKEISDSSNITESTIASTSMDYVKQDDAIVNVVEALVRRLSKTVIHAEDIDATETIIRRGLLTRPLTEVSEIFEQVFRFLGYNRFNVDPIQVSEDIVSVLSVPANIKIKHEYGQFKQYKHIHFVITDLSDNYLSTPDYQDRIYVYNYGDIHAPNVNLPVIGNVSSNVEYSPAGSHLYEVPGTYIPTCKVYDKNTGSYLYTLIGEQIEIISLEEHYTADNTICISNDNTFEGAIPGATLVPFITEIDTYLNTIDKSNKCILLKKGNSFTASVGLSGTIEGMFLGTFGELVAKPVITCANGGSAGSKFFITNTSTNGLVLHDLEFTCPDSTFWAFVSGHVGYTVAYCRAYGSYVPFGASTDLGNAVPSLGMPDNLGLYYNEAYNTNNVVVYIGGNRIGIVGNYFHNSNATHVLRITYGQYTNVSLNRLEYAGGTRMVLKLHANQNHTLYGAYSDGTCITRNYFLNNKNYVVDLGVQDALKDERIRNVVFRYNVLKALPGVQYNLVLDSPSHVCVDNNLFINSATSWTYVGVRISKQAAAQICSGIRIFNNTHVNYYNNNVTQDFVECNTGSHDGAILVKNNIMYTVGNTRSPQIAARITVGTHSDYDISNNLVNVDPQFEDIAAEDYRLTAVSPAVGTGTVVPAMLSFGKLFRNPNSVDIGAYQLLSSSGEVIKYTNEISEISEIIISVLTMLRLDDNVLDVGDDIKRITGLIKSSLENPQIVDQIISYLGSIELVDDSADITEAVILILKKLGATLEAGVLTDEVYKLLGLVRAITNTSEIDENITRILLPDAPTVDVVPIIDILNVGDSSTSVTDGVFSIEVYAYHPAGIQKVSVTFGTITKDVYTKQSVLEEGYNTKYLYVARFTLHELALIGAGQHFVSVVAYPNDGHSQNVDYISIFNNVYYPDPNNPIPTDLIESIVVYLDTNATAEGDGSLSSPARTLQEAVGLIQSAPKVAPSVDVARGIGDASRGIVRLLGRIPGSVSVQTLNLNIELKTKNTFITIEPDAESEDIHVKLVGIAKDPGRIKFEGIYFYESSPIFNDNVNTTNGLWFNNCYIQANNKISIGYTSRQGWDKGLSFTKCRFINEGLGIYNATLLKDIQVSTNKISGPVIYDCERIHNVTVYPKEKENNLVVDIKDPKRFIVNGLRMPTMYSGGLKISYFNPQYTKTNSIITNVLLGEGGLEILSVYNEEINNIFIEHITSINVVSVTNMDNVHISNSIVEGIIGIDDFNIQHCHFITGELKGASPTNGNIEEFPLKIFDEYTVQSPSDALTTGIYTVGVQHPPSNLGVGAPIFPNRGCYGDTALNMLNFLEYYDGTYATRMDLKSNIAETVFSFIVAASIIAKFGEDITNVSETTLALIFNGISKVNLDVFNIDELVLFFKAIKNKITEDTVVLDDIKKFLVSYKDTSENTIIIERVLAVLNQEYIWTKNIIINQDEL